MCANFKIPCQAEEGVRCTQLLFMLELYLAVPDIIEILFQLLSHPEPAVLSCVPPSMPPAVWL